MNLLGKLSSFLVVFILSLILLPSFAVASMNWHDDAGAGSGGGMIAVTKFYPQTITINEGDSITWTAVGDAHTVTFLSGRAAPSPLSDEAFTPSGGNSYNGSGFVNSGMLMPGQNYTLTFTKSGTYDYVCLFHPGMTGKVVVQPVGTAYPHNQNFYDQQRQINQVTDATPGYNLVTTTTNPTAIEHSDGTKTYFDTAGIGNGYSSVMRFLPQIQVIREGDLIQWTNRDPVMPHTISFPPKGGDVSETFAPVGSLTYDGSAFTSSGVLMANQNYTLKFTKAGSYDYECILHDDLGMKGTIVVLPKI